MKHMPKFSLVTFPDPLLEQVSEPVEKADQTEARVLADSMINVMSFKRGWGLSAIQVAVPWRLFVMKIDPVHSSIPYGNPMRGLPWVFVNPRIVEASPITVKMNEGCLSFPGLTENIERPKEVALIWTDVTTWQEQRAIFCGWEARCIQHEMDHLDGKCITSKMLPAAVKKLRKRALQGRRL